jgi:hypothetical protein
MSEKEMSLEQIQELPDEVKTWLKGVAEAKTAGTEVPVATIDGLFKGSSWDSVRSSLKDKGFATYTADGDDAGRFLAVDADENGQIFAMAAAIPRTPGRAEDFLKQIADFRDDLSANVQDRKDKVQLFHKIYEAEGLVNNAINKCIPKDESIQLANGVWVAFGDLQVGDQILGVAEDDTATPVTVTAVSDSGVKPVWRIYFTDGTVLRATDEHMIPVYWGSGSIPRREISVAEIRHRVETIKARGSRPMLFRPKVTLFAEREEPLIPPYALGAMLGGGSFRGRGVRFTSADSEVVDRLNMDLAAMGYHAYKEAKSKYGYVISPLHKEDTAPFKPGKLTTALRVYGLDDRTSHTKFVPDEYKYGSVAVRTEVLAGLVDTDGDSCGGFSTVSFRLAEDVCDIARSLGGWSSLTPIKTQYKVDGELRYSTAYHVRVGVNNLPVALGRKQVAQNRRTNVVGIERIEYEGDCPVADISVDNETRWFLCNGFTVHNSAALVATKGSFKVRRVKGKQGQSKDKRAQEFHALLRYWSENVNANGKEAVKTGDRGITQWVGSGVRQSLIEGDHISRKVWTTVDVPHLGKMDLPMNLQSFSAAHIEIPEGLEGLPVELMYWVPPQKLIDLMEDPKDKNVKEYLDKLIGKDVIAELKKNKKYLLTPQLLLHIKHRSLGFRNFGSSMIAPAMADVRYKRALDALELVTIENLINRLVIVKVGSDDPKSVYHQQAVSASRLNLLQRMFRRIGPSATILWAGPDIDVVEVGAHNSILDLDGRYSIAERRIRSSLGVPAALLTGEGTDGKAAGWAAALGLAAQLGELQESYRQALRGIAEEIAEENGFEDVDVTFEFHNDLLMDKQAAAEIIMKAFGNSLITIQTALEALGFSFEAEEVRMLEEVENGYRDEAFGPPKHRATINPNGDGGEDGGRPTKKEKPNQDDEKEDRSPNENK